MLKYARVTLPATRRKENEMAKCETCNDTGYYGDMGPGIKGNYEYHRCDICKIDPPVLDELDQAKAELAKVKAERDAMKKTIRPIMKSDGKQGWTLDYKQILRIKEMAENVEHVSLEQTEAVMMSMLDNHFAILADEATSDAAEAEEGESIKEK